MQTDAKIIPRHFLLAIILITLLFMYKDKVLASCDIPIHDDSIHCCLMNEFTAKELSLKVEGMAFLRDNEYDPDMCAGYTLPGAWIRPALQYNPLGNIHIELGVSGLIYEGANKYPSYAYSDIAKWKGCQYQEGVHLLPWFRAEYKIGKLDLILGDIYGGVFHELITPLYNKEHVLSSDPEMGGQILYNGKYFRTDIFINWQSFQFNMDTHQEAFETGIVATAKPLGGKSDLLLKLAILAQHRGGELDVTDAGAQTISNSSVGIAYDRTFTNMALSHFNVETDLLYCHQKSGDLWKFSKGAAFNLSASATYKNIHGQIGYFYVPKNFISVFGNPYFSTVSLRDKNRTYSSNRNIYLDVGYSYCFSKDYVLGVNFEGFAVHPGGCNIKFPVSFGLYMMMKPEFILKQF